MAQAPRSRRETVDENSVREAIKYAEKYAGREQRRFYKGAQLTSPEAKVETRARSESSRPAPSSQPRASGSMKIRDISPTRASWRAERLAGSELSVERR